MLHYADRRGRFDQTTWHMQCISLLMSLQLLGQATAEVVDVGRALAMMQNAGQRNGVRGPTAVAARKEIAGTLGHSASAATSVDAQR